MPPLLRYSRKSPVLRYGCFVLERSALLDCLPHSLPTCADCVCAATSSSLLMLPRVKVAATGALRLGVVALCMILHLSTVPLSGRLVSHICLATCYH